jgi:protein phosphatase
MIIHHFSHIGSRNSNQDFVEIQSYNDIDFFIVADGIGGYENGDLAAQMAVESIIVYLTNVDEINQDHIQKAINKANLAIRQKQQSLQCKMGTTIGGCLVKNSIVHCFWVGDVAVYQIRDGVLLWESRSHNIFNEGMLENRNNFNIKSSRLRHVVTRSISGDISKSIIGYQAITTGNFNDIFIICSDGVHEYFDGFRISQMLKNEINHKKVIEKIEKELELIGQDNYSLISFNLDAQLKKR